MKKGFTLIELLAVIVILAIIALITVPVVINIMNNTKKGAAEDSTYGIIESLKLYWMNAQQGFEESGSSITITCGKSSCVYVHNGAPEVISFEAFYSMVSGTIPSEGIYEFSNGKVTVSNVKYGDYYCNSDENEKIICSKTKAFYAYFDRSGLSPTTVSETSQVRPDTRIYFRYKVINNTLGTPQACVYYETKELCINNNEKEASLAKLQEFFGTAACHEEVCGIADKFLYVTVSEHSIYMEDYDFTCTLDNTSVHCAH